MSLILILFAVCIISFIARGYYEFFCGEPSKRFIISKTFEEDCNNCKIGKVRECSDGNLRCTNYYKASLYGLALRDGTCRSVINFSDE